MTGTVKQDIAIERARHTLAHLEAGIYQMDDGAGNVHHEIAIGDPGFWESQAGQLAGVVDSLLAAFAPCPCGGPASACGNPNHAAAGIDATAQASR